MADEYVPTTDEVREHYAYDHMVKPLFNGGQEQVEAARVAFDVWLASVKEKAWDEGYASHDQGYLSDANPYKEET